MEKPKDKECRYCRQSIPENADKCFQCNEWQREKNVSQPPPPQNIWSLASSTEQIFKTLGLLSGVMLLLTAGLSLVIYTLNKTLPAASSVEMKKEGSVIFTKFGEKKAVFLLSPNGTRYDSIPNPWISTGIEVKKDDVITITASGEVSLSVHHTVDAAVTDSIPIRPWSDPNGVPKNWPGARKVDRYRQNYVLAKCPSGEPIQYGKLIGQIVPKNQQVPIKSTQIFEIGIGAPIPAFESGILYLTVNEIWLTTDENNKIDFENSKAAYIPPPEGNDLYYLDRVNDKDLINNLFNLSNEIKRDLKNQNDIDELRRKEKQMGLNPKETAFLKALNAAVTNGFSVQEKRWAEIVRLHYDNIWYDDNVGAFSVTIEINK